MRIVKTFPAPHVEMRVSVSEQMESDLKKCYEKSRAGEPGDCDTCSWFEIDIEMNKGTSLCGDAEIAGKILGKDKEKNMSYEKFVEEIADIIRSRINRDVRISVHTVTKNNGYERKGITFFKEGSMAAPTIYLERYYEEYIEGDGLGEIGMRILGAYHKEVAQHGLGEKVAEHVRDYQNIKDKIIYKLVNRERNKELLSQVPHEDYLDLAVLFYVVVNIDETGEELATMLIQNEHLIWWKVSAEEIRRRAQLNTEKLLPYEFCAMCMVIEEMLGDRDMGDEDWRKLKEQENMYVLTNHLRNWGASVLLYSGRLEAIGAYFKENYYILPSSIHEVILIPESKAVSKEEMEGVVREVNETEVQTEEFLSDHVYYYDRTRLELMTA